MPLLGVLSLKGGIMTKAARYVDHMYSLYRGRAAVTVGVNSELNSVHPLVFENRLNIPIGLIALSPDGLTNPDSVDIYHISAFMPGESTANTTCDFLFPLIFNRLRRSKMVARRCAAETLN